MQTDDDEPNEDIFHPEPTPRRRTHATKAMAVAAIALVLAALLDADGLRTTAEHQNPGGTRSAAIWVTQNLVQPVSHALLLNRPREWIDSAIGVEDRHKITSTDAVRLAPTPTQPPVGTTTTTTTMPSRIPTPADPLRVLVSGDSLSENLDPPLIDALVGKPANVNEDSEIGTGLARPDVADWPTKLAHDMQSGRYDAVVLMFGGNDAQDLFKRNADGSSTWVDIGNRAAWDVEYEKRIALVMDTILAANPMATIVWVGLPAMTGGVSPYLKQVWPAINALAAREAAARPKNVVYVDGGSVLDGPGNSFQTYANSGGSQVQVRESDGVHFTIAGGHRIVDQLVLPVLARRYHLF
jgi:hypothetical protein